MATPTGYKFLDGTIKDFADVFNITNTGTVTTGYTSAVYNKDLGEIFEAGNSGKTTNYFNPSNIDLGSIFALKNTGPWFALGLGITGTVASVVIDSSDNVYVGGEFTSAGGVPVNNIAMWVPGTGQWYSLSNGVSNGVTGFPVAVSSMAIDSSNNVYVGGTFTTAGGVLVNNIALWVPSAPGAGTWYALGTGVLRGSFLPSVLSIAIDSSNNVYVGGQFTTAGGVPVNNIALWVPSIPGAGTWYTLGTGVTGSGALLASSIAIDSSNNIYVGGIFTTAGGVLVNNIALWVPSGPGTGTWSALISGSYIGLSGATAVNTVAIDSSDNVYVGGQFATVVGITVNNIIKWVPSAPGAGTWLSLSTGLTGASNVVYTISVDSSNNVYVGGSFLSAGATTVQRIAMWDPVSSTWSPLGNNGVGNAGGGPAPIVSAIFINNLNYVYAGGTFTSAGTIFANNIAYYVPIITPAPAPPSPTIPYTVTGGTNWTQSIAGSDYTLTFNVDMSIFVITFLVNLNITVVVVGGGGGGGGGTPNSSPSVGGGGGGSGGIGSLLQTISPISYNIVVGVNGLSGQGNQPGGPGGNSSFGTLISSTGGGGGNANYGGGTQLAGTSTYNSIYGGNGGNGYNVSAGTSGYNADSGSYGGGGGGGNNGTDGGKAGSNGIGGAYGSNSMVGGGGEIAISYGSGGGGGAGSAGIVGAAGGLGGPGVVIITFTYP